MSNSGTAKLIPNAKNGPTTRKGRHDTRRRPPSLIFSRIVLIYSSKFRFVQLNANGGKSEEAFLWRVPRTQKCFKCHCETRNPNRTIMELKIYYPVLVSRERSEILPRWNGRQKVLNRRKYLCLFAVFFFLPLAQCCKYYRSAGFKYRCPRWYRPNNYREHRAGGTLLNLFVTFRVLRAGWRSRSSRNRSMPKNGRPIIQLDRRDLSVSRVPRHKIRKKDQNK